jgi:outer membrane lipoprotein SlyB
MSRFRFFVSRPAWVFYVLVGMALCAYAQYTGNQVNTRSRVLEGVVLQVVLDRQLEASPEVRAVGGVVGGALGAWAGNLLADPNWKSLFGITGAAVGGLAGTNVAGSAMGRKVDEITVKVYDKYAISPESVYVIVEPSATREAPFAVGEPVQVVQIDNKWRVFRRTYGSAEK